jgi:hypothetical protein
LYHEVSEGGNCDVEFCAEWNIIFGDHIMSVTLTVWVEVSCLNDDEEKLEEIRNLC